MWRRDSHSTENNEVSAVLNAFPTVVLYLG